MLSYRLILLSAVAWQQANAMTHILVPLFAYSLGYSNLTIGALISLPMLLHAVMRLVGGALADRWSEKTILVICFLLVALAGPTFLMARDLALLLTAQMFMVLSRALFYSATQSYVSRVPSQEPMGKRLGSLHVATGLGDIIGMVVAGVLVVALGFGAGFLVLSALGVVALLTGLLLPPLPTREGKRSILEIWGKMVDFGRKRQMLLIILAAFGAALPSTLSGSFFPLFITHLGHSEEVVGIVSAFRSGGSIFTGWLIARAIGVRTLHLFFRLGYLGLGASVILLPFSGELALVAFLIGLSGVSGAILDITYQTMIARLSDDTNRASAFALGGMGWSLCHLVVPVSFGATVDRWGFDAAFYAFGLCFIGVAAAAALLFKWLMPRSAQDRDQVALARAH